VSSSRDSYIFGREGVLFVPTNLVRIIGNGLVCDTRARKDNAASARLAGKIEMGKTSLVSRPSRRKYRNERLREDTHVRAHVTRGGLVRGPGGCAVVDVLLLLLRGSDGRTGALLLRVSPIKVGPPGRGNRPSRVRKPYGAGNRLSRRPPRNDGTSRFHITFGSSFPSCALIFFDLGSRDIGERMRTIIDYDATVETGVYLFVRGGGWAERAKLKKFFKLKYTYSIRK